MMIEGEDKGKDNLSCKNGVTSLTLHCLDSGDEDIRVVQKDGKKDFFEDQVDPGETFSFSGEKADGAVGEEVSLYVDGKKRGELRTDCKKPIGPGLTEKEFEVVSGASLGGPLGPVNDR